MTNHTQKQLNKKAARRKKIMKAANLRNAKPKLTMHVIRKIVSKKEEQKVEPKKKGFLSKLLS